jgi:hypothetical protein
MLAALHHLENCMRPLRVLALALALTTPAAASAGATLAFSVGSGWQTSPSERTPTNVMLAPGWAIGPLRAEVGLAAALADVTNPTTGRADTELEVRPMLVIAPPTVPVYGRAILAVTNLVDGPRDVAYGGALGLSFDLAGAGVFVEAGVLPRSVTVALPAGGTDDELRWFVEGRVGVSYAF